jgi:hypothetical protein
MTSIRILLVGLLASLVGACTGLTRRPQHPGESDHLAGIWEVCLLLHEPSDESPKLPFSSGYFALIPMNRPTQAWMYLGQPTHYGVYTADIGVIGVTRDPRIPLPLAGARVAGDSLNLVLDPFGSHGPIVLKGQLRRDTASGTWFHQAYALGAEGSFSLKRIDNRSLPVPYPVGGPLTPPAIAGCMPTVG